MWWVALFVSNLVYGVSGFAVGIIFWHLFRGIFHG